MRNKSPRCSASKYCVASRRQSRSVRARGSRRLQGPESAVAAVGAEGAEGAVGAACGVPDAAAAGPSGAGFTSVGDEVVDLQEQRMNRTPRNDVSFPLMRSSCSPTSAGGKTAIRRVLATLMSGWRLLPERAGFSEIPLSVHRCWFGVVLRVSSRDAHQTAIGEWLAKWTKRIHGPASFLGQRVSGQHGRRPGRWASGSQ